MSEPTEQSEPIEQVLETVETVDSMENKPNVSEIMATDFQDLQNIPTERPPTMSKSQWKKLQRKVKFQEHKKEYIKIRKEKKKQNNLIRREEIQKYIDNNEEIPEFLIKKSKKPPIDQKKSGAKIIIDCSFEHMMNDKEKVSLASQITRSYAANKISPTTIDLQIASFGGALQRRFEVDMKSSAFQNWKNITFDTAPIDTSDKEHTIYLSADASDVLTTLEPGMSYIIGGIVDKGRYKYLCRDKAKELGLKCMRLPIDEYLEGFVGRQVLTTTHVVELMIEWFNLKDWKQAFEKVLPARKMDSGLEETASAEISDVNEVNAAGTVEEISFEEVPAEKTPVEETPETK